MSGVSKTPLYAMVAYVRGPVATFVEDLRAELHPEQAHLAAHITVLPPRELKAPEDVAIRELKERAGRFLAFEVEFGETEAFAPTTPTVFIRIAKSAHRFRDMHEAFDAGACRYDEQWPYMPHLTIVKLPTFEQIVRAAQMARERWASFPGARTAPVKELTFVREGEGGLWIDLATISLIE